MGWGEARRPKISNKLGIPNRAEGSDGDIQVRQTNLGAKLYGKIGGRWNSTFLSSEEEIIGTSGTKIGMDSSGALTVDQIKLNGKITLTSTGTQNVCIGTGNNDIGTQDIIIGVNAGNALTGSSNKNVLIGYHAGLLMENGTQNVCIGTQAGDANVSGETNTLVGVTAGGLLTTDNNTCIGSFAGQTTTSGENIVCIGYAAYASASGTDNEIVIGKSASGQGENYAVIGNADITRVYAAEDGAGVLYANATIVSSDKRIKEDVEGIGIGLDFVNKLFPIKYTQKQPADYEQSLKEKLSWYGKKDPRVIENTEKERIRAGFLAQDVMDVLKELGFNENNGMVQIDDTTTQYSMDYSSMVVPLTKAVQELSAKIDTMQTEINNLKAE